VSISFYGVDSTTISRGCARMVGEDDALNLANENACALLGLLELPREPHGNVPIPEARRAIIKARALFDRKADAFTRKADEGHGVQGARFFVAALDSVKLQNYLERFAHLVERFAGQGCTHIYWA
jgi:hypothetical protein